MSDEPIAARAPHRIGGIFWQRNFRLFWTGETISGAGTSTAVVGIPLLAVQVLHAGTFAVSALTAASNVPWLFIGLLAGAWVDRLPSRSLMIICDIIAAVLYASLPIAAWLGILTIGQVIAVALLAGTADLFFTLALQVFLPAVIRPEDLIEGNAKLQGSNSVGTIGGRSIAGLLAEAVGDAAALLVNAISFLVSAACLLAIRTDAPPPRPARPKSTIRGEVGESVRYTMRDPYLRPMTIYPILANLGYSGATALLVLFLVRVVGLSSLAVGVLLAAAGAGGIVGALVARRIATALGTARALIVVVLGNSVFGLLIPLTTKGAGVTYFAVGLSVVAAGFTVTSTIGGSFRQTYTPPEMLGRVTAIMRFPSFCAMPVGALLAGALGTFLSIRAALWIMFVIYASSGLFLIFSKVRHDKNLPTGRSTAQPAAAAG